jgi:hypothetical protein
MVGFFRSVVDSPDLHLEANCAVSIRIRLQSRERTSPSRVKELGYVMRARQRRLSQARWQAARVGASGRAD